MLRAEGLVVVYTTSDPRDAFNLGDEVLLLDRHALVQVGSPLQVYQSPACSAAADLMSDPGINRWRRDEILCAVRPEHLEVRPPRADDVVFSSELLSMETNGSQTYLHCLVEAEHWVATIDAPLATLSLPQVGERLELVARSDAVLRFPGERRDD
jgi:ABC-type sugar transport system ATPase subunit